MGIHYTILFLSMFRTSINKIKNEWFSMFRNFEANAMNLGESIVNIQMGCYTWEINFHSIQTQNLQALWQGFLLCFPRLNEASVFHLLWTKECQCSVGTYHSSSVMVKLIFDMHLFSFDQIFNTCLVIWVFVRRVPHLLK